MYQVVHYTDFGFKTTVICETPSLEIACLVCDYCGDNSLWEEGYCIQSLIDEDLPVFDGYHVPAGLL